MKSLEKIKNDYAVNKGYDDWLHLLLTTTRNNEYYILELHIEAVMVQVQKECLKLASEVNDTYSCRNNIDEPFKVYVSKESITNENNIIK